jgi:hypothetical protein
MKMSREEVVIELQRKLNSRFYREGKISFELYRAADEVLLSRLTTQQQKYIIK